jgi:hypothetical protein
VTKTELRDLLVGLLVGAAGGARGRWEAMIGPITVVPIWQNVDSNWSVRPTATGDELGAIRKVVELVRAEHPYVGS